MKLYLDASEMLADDVSPYPGTEPPPTSENELIIITAVCSSLISITGLIMAALLCSWCFGRKKYDANEEEESLNEYKPVAYGGDDNSSIRDSSIAGITPNQSPSHNGSSQCNSSSTQHLTSVGQKKSSRFDRHHGDKHKIATEHVQLPTNSNQGSHMVTEDTVAVTQQKRRPSKELENKAWFHLNQQAPSIPLEVLDTKQGNSSQDDPPKPNQRKSSITSIQSISEKACNIFGLNESRKKSEPNVIIEEVPGTSSEVNVPEKKSDEATNLKSKIKHLPLPPACVSSWYRIRAKLPLIIHQKKFEKNIKRKRRASMFASREDFLRRFSINDPLQEKSSSLKTESRRKSFLRKFSLDSHLSAKEEPVEESVQVSNVKQLIALFKEKIQEETDRPARQLRRESKIKVRQLKRKYMEQEKIKRYGNSPYYVNSSQSAKDTTPPKASQNISEKNVVSEKNDQTPSPEKPPQNIPRMFRRCSRVMTEEEKQKAYVNLIKRRREVQEMRKQYLQKTGSSVEVDSSEYDPPIPADIEL